MIRFPFFGGRSDKKIILAEIGETGARMFEFDKGEQEVSARQAGSFFFKDSSFSLKEALDAVERLLRPYSKSRPDVVIGLRPGVARATVQTCSYPLPSQGAPMSSSQAARLTQEMKAKAAKELSDQLAGKTGIMSQDFVLLSLRLFHFFIDGYAVARLEGFSGKEATYGALGVFLVKSQEALLDAFKKKNKQYRFTVVHAVEALANLSRERALSGVYADIGGNTSQITSISGGEILHTEEFKGGGNDLLRPLERNLGMTWDAAHEFAGQYASRGLSEQVGRRVRDLLAPEARMLADRIEETIKSFYSTPIRTLSLFGEGSALGELAEAIKEKNTAAPFLAPEGKVKTLPLGDLLAGYVSSFRGSSKAPLRFHSMPTKRKFFDIIPPQNASRREERPHEPFSFLRNDKKGNVPPRLTHPRAKDQRESKPSPRESSSAETLPANVSVLPDTESSGLGKRGRGSYRSLIMTIGLVLLCGGLTAVLLMHTIFARATVIVWPQTRSIASEEKVTADTAAQVIRPDLETVPAVRISEEKEATRLFNATGKKPKATSARGILTVYNAYSTAPRVLVANTRFISETGKLFRSQQKISLPGASYRNGDLVPGTVDVAVTAAEPGTGYNIGPSTFALPGLAGTALFTAVYAKSAQAMAGGEQSSVTVVTADDIARAKDELVANLTKQTQERVGAKIPDGFTLLPSFLTSGTTASSVLAKEGAELEQFNVSAKVRSTAIVFREADVRGVVEKNAAKSLADYEQMEGGGTTLSIRADRMDEARGVAILAVSATVTGVSRVSQDDLKGALAGMPKHKAETMLASYPHLARHQVSVWPFWRSALPVSSGKINLFVRVGE